MHRQSGRYPNNEYYVVIECLPDDQLFSPSQIAKRKFDKNLHPSAFQKMFHAIYQFGIRNGLAIEPDNCVRKPGGKPVLERDKAKLKPGERSAKWLGKTWKSKLYIEDRIAIKKFVATKLLKTLVCIQEEKENKSTMTQTKPSSKPIPITRSSRKLKLWAVALIAAILFTAGAAYNYTFLNQGYGILRADGAKAAYQFFQNRGVSFDNLFGQAWAAFRAGEYKQSEKLAKQVLTSRNLKDRARANYLLGTLKTTSGDFEEAKEYLLAAEAIYDTLQNERSLYRTHLVQAKLYLSVKDLDNANYYTNLASMNETAQSDEYFFYIQSQIAFSEGQYQQALELSLTREKLVGSDQSQMPSVYSDIGFYYGLLGYQDQCLNYTIKAESIASAQEDTNAMMYNNINMCLYLKCTMRDYGQLRESILRYARTKNEVRLMEHVYFVDKFTCPMIRTGNGHPPPPDKTHQAPGAADPIEALHQYIPDQEDEEQ